MNATPVPEARAELRSPLSDSDADTIAKAMVRALQQARSVSDSEHYDHHRWITLKIDAEKQRAEFWTKMTTHVVNWGAVSVLSALVYALYLGFKAWVARGG